MRKSLGSFFKSCFWLFRTRCLLLVAPLRVGEPAQRLVKNLVVMPGESLLLASRSLERLTKTNLKKVRKLLVIFPWSTAKDWSSTIGGITQNLKILKEKLEILPVIVGIEPPFCLMDEEWFAATEIALENLATNAEELSVIKVSTKLGCHPVIYTIGIYHKTHFMQDRQVWAYIEALAQAVGIRLEWQPALSNNRKRKHKQKSKSLTGANDDEANIEENPGHKKKRADSQANSVTNTNEESSKKNYRNNTSKKSSRRKGSD